MSPTSQTTRQRKIKFIELFAGIGGFRKGIEQASDNFECVYANEWDKYAAQIYKKQFGELDTRDITTVRTEEIPDHDLLVGGFPCQAFSIAGKRGGFDDTRGTLFFDVARILKDKQPKFFILENVKGLLSHDGGSTFKTIISTLTELGYDLQWQVLNSKNFGVPQNRERVFIIGNLTGERRPEIFPIGEGNRKDNESANKLQVQYSNTLRTGYGTKWSNETYVAELKQLRGGSQGYRVYDPSGISSTLADEAGGVGAKTGLYAIPVLAPDRLEKRQNGRRFKDDGDPAFTLTAQDRHGIFDGVSIRRLTPTECERLQGFPDNFTKYGIDSKGNEILISDTQRYKVLGNAVTTSVVMEIVKRLLRSFL